jgi:hypothetical protein
MVGRRLNVQVLRPGAHLPALAAAIVRAYVERWGREVRPCVEEIGANPTATRWPFRFPVLAVVVMDASAHLPTCGDQFPLPFCIMSSRMAASTAARSAWGLNITSSVPATAAGTCPGGM